MYWFFVAGRERAVQKIMNARRAIRLMATVAVAGACAALSAPSASASQSDCASGLCVWSGENYTGTMVNLTIPGLNNCFTPTAEGFDATRSADVTDPTFNLVFYDNADCTGTGQLVMYRSVAAFDSPKHGIKAYLNRS
ncbi:peptidase inhibitor family I36 protein [Amycolatopsis taiwanensis]|uniref:peptidase inhibitor family I36 protein n=1 Tax=Amycolatopsis taiwanensis TaxID=342230 RepID=UPI0012EC1BDF|nr:peptidase inhibitor family I36 protein [Amycolatopsis taiwanensis]